MSDVRPGLWRSVGHGWRIFVPTALVSAALQTLLATLGVTPALGPGFVLVLAASFVVAALTVWLLAAGAVAAVHRERFRLRVAALGWAALVVAVAAATAVLLPPLAAVVAVAGALVVVASSAGGRVAFSGRLGWWALQALAAVALVLAIDFALGFFVAGPASAFLANLTAAALGAVILVGAARLVQRD